MLYSLLEGIVLLLSFLISVLAVYFKIPIGALQQAIAFMVVVLLLLLNRLILTRSRPPGPVPKLLLIFLAALLFELIIFTSGGFYSPFLIIFHLFAVAASFLISLRTAIVFLVMAVLALLADLWIDPQLQLLFISDPGPIILYTLSFLAIIPLYYLIGSRYNVKDAVVKILTRQIKLSELREQTLLSGLSDIVLILDTNLRILSFNEAAERVLGLSAPEIANRKLFEIVFLKDINGRIVDNKLLSIDQVIADKTTHIVNKLLLYTKNTAMPRTVNIQVKPGVNLEGAVDEIILVVSGITDLDRGENLPHQGLEEAGLRYKAMLESIKNELQAKNLTSLQVKTMLLGKSEEDLLLAREIEDHGIKPKSALVDVAELIRRNIVSEQVLAGQLHVNLEFSFDEHYLLEASTHIPKGSNFSPQMLTSAYFTVNFDMAWLDLLIKKILDLSLLLVAGQSNPAVKIRLSYDQDDVIAAFVCTLSVAPEADLNQLLLPYYGVFKEYGRLRLGSGLEGMLIRAIAVLMNIKYDIRFQEKLPAAVFTFRLSKKPILS